MKYLLALIAILTPALCQESMAHHPWLRPQPNELPVSYAWTNAPMEVATNHLKIIQSDEFQIIHADDFKKAAKSARLVARERTYRATMKSIQTAISDRMGKDPLYGYELEYSVNIEIPCEDVSSFRLVAARINAQLLKSGWVILPSSFRNPLSAYSSDGGCFNLITIEPISK